jgi:hypothetical protein
MPIILRGAFGPVHSSVEIVPSSLALHKQSLVTHMKLLGMRIKGGIKGSVLTLGLRII